MTLDRHIFISLDNPILSDGNFQFFSLITKFFFDCWNEVTQPFLKKKKKNWEEIHLYILDFSKESLR